MITVKYERYWCDYHRKHEQITLSSLSELENWIFGQMRRDTRDPFAMSFPTPAAAERINADGPWAIEFKPDHGEPDIWIHLIECSGGIIFSDGKYTSGQKHWSKEVQSWLIKCEQRKNTPKFNFVE